MIKKPVRYCERDALIVDGDEKVLLHVFYRMGDTTTIINARGYELERMINQSSEVSVPNAPIAAPESVVPTVEPKPETAPVNENKLSDQPLSVRTINCLAREKIYTIADVMNFTEEELLSLDGFGKTCLEEVKVALKSFGLKLKK